MARALSIQERVVGHDERAEYLASLVARRARAAGVPAHFWVFEHATEPGRFVEFTEAANDADVVAAHGDPQAPALWREVQGG